MQSSNNLTLSGTHTYILKLHRNLDQSGLIGMLRQLHNFGCVILSLESEQEVL